MRCLREFLVLWGIIFGTIHNCFSHYDLVKEKISIGVAIIDHDLQVSNSLVRMLDSTDGLQCVGAYSSVANALDEISVSRPDVVLMDINLPAVNGVKGVRRLKAACRDLLILVFTDIENANIVFNAFAAGAVGYLLKPDSPGQIIAAIQEVYDGGSPMSSTTARQMVGLLQETAISDENYWKLSLRELEVIGHLAGGLRYQDIADKLKISYATVHTHIRHIYKKLKTKSRTDAVSLHLRHVASCQNPTNKLHSQPVAFLNQVGIPEKSRHLIGTEGD